jgi:hypothetical protein
MPDCELATTKPRGGFCLIPAEHLARLWWAYRNRLIRFLDLRAALAAREILARRCSLPAGRPPRFTVDEIATLTRSHPRSLRPALARLRDAGLLTWHEHSIEFDTTPERRDDFHTFLRPFVNLRRGVPVPRRILRYIALANSPVLVATAFAALLRCLYRRDGRIHARGRIKASWVAQSFGVDLRRVKHARAHLVRLRWLLPDDGDPQWAMNRWGRAYHVDPHWRPQPTDERTDTPPPEAGVGLDTPPPDSSDREPLPRDGNQEPAPGRPAGVRRTGPGKPGEATGGGARPPAPDLRRVRPEDLSDTARLLELHRQAAGRGLVSEGEAGRLRVLAAAEHARSRGDRNPSGLFASVVARGLWSFLSGSDEDAASSRWKEYLRGGPPRPPSSAVTGSRGRASGSVGLSSDASLLGRLGASSGGGEGVYHSLRRLKSPWTRSRYEEALRELERWRLGSVGVSRSVGTSGYSSLSGVLSGLGAIGSSLGFGVEGGIEPSPVR